MSCQINNDEFSYSKVERLNLCGIDGPGNNEAIETTEELLCMRLYEIYEKQCITLNRDENSIINNLDSFWGSFFGYLFWVPFFRFLFLGSFFWFLFLVPFFGSFFFGSFLEVISRCSFLGFLSGGSLKIFCF